MIKNISFFFRIVLCLNLIIFLELNNISAYPKKNQTNVETPTKKKSEAIIEIEKENSDTNSKTDSKSNDKSDLEIRKEIEKKNQTQTNSSKNIDINSFLKKNQTGEENNKDKEFIEEIIKVEIQVELNDGRSLKGIAQLNSPGKITSEHIKNRIKYKKAFEVREIDFIEIKSWKPKYYKSNSTGDVYSFETNRFLVQLKSGQALMQEGPLFNFLREFTVSNEHGEAHLYSFWLDLYQKDGNWSTGLIGSLGVERSTGHKEVIRKIKFRNAD